MERYKSWLKYMPPGATNYGIAEEIDVFTQGKVATCLQWAAVGLAMITPENKDKVLVVPPPKFGAKGAEKRIYCMGGQPWVINAFNDDAKMRVAIDFMNWWYLPETALEYAKRGGNPCDKATMGSANFDSINPWNRAYKFMLEPGTLAGLLARSEIFGNAGAAAGGLHLLHDGPIQGRHGGVELHRLRPAADPLRCRHGQEGALGRLR